MTVDFPVAEARHNRVVNAEAVGYENTKGPSTSSQGALYENIGFVYGWTGFVLHVASKGDKVRVTRSTLGRNRKCCCEHQLLLRSTRAARGLGLPRQPLPNKETTVLCKTVRTPTFTFQRC